MDVQSRLFVILRPTARIVEGNIDVCMDVLRDVAQAFGDDVADLTAGVRLCSKLIRDLSRDDNRRAVYAQPFRSGPRRVRIDAVLYLLRNMGLSIDDSQWDGLAQRLRDASSREMDVQTIPDETPPPAPSASSTELVHVGPRHVGGSNETTALVAAARYLQDMTPHQLATELARRDLTIDSLKRKLKLAQQDCRRLRARVDQAIVPRTSSADSSLSIERSGRYFTLKASMALAIRRSLGNIAGRHMSAVSLEAIDKSTVYAAELKCGSALLSVSRDFHAACNSMFAVSAIGGDSGPSDAIALASPGSSRGGFAIFAISGDASNTEVAQKAKVHNLLVESGYVCADDLEGTSSPLEQCRWHRELADLQVVCDATGVGARNMIATQVASLGVPTWVDARAEVDATKRLQEQGADVKPRVFVYCFTSDQGSDESRAKKIIQAETADIDEILVWSVDCFMHNPHLIVKSGLRICDRVLEDTHRTYSYFGSLAKLVNVWRDSGKDRVCMHSVFRIVIHEVSDMMIFIRGGASVICENSGCGHGT